MITLLRAAARTGGSLGGRGAAVRGRERTTRSGPTEIAPPAAGFAHRAPSPPHSQTHAAAAAATTAPSTPSSLARLEDASLPPPSFIVGEARPPPPLLELGPAIAAVKVG